MEIVSTPRNVSAKTANMNERFNENKAHNKLEQYYPQLNKIISVLCNANYADDLDILNFLMGKKPIEECGCLANPFANARLKQATSKIQQHLPSFKSILVERQTIWGGTEHYISEDIAACLNEVLNGGYFGIWFDTDGSADKLHQLYLQTLPKKASDSVGNINFAELRKNGTFPIEDCPISHVNASLGTTQFVANVATNAERVIRENNKYNHWKFNRQLGTQDLDLTQINQNRLFSYFDNFATYLGILREQVPSYLEAHPITVLYDQELTNMATADKGLVDGKKYEAPTMSNLKQLCALDESETIQRDGRLVKHGAITSMPGAFVFGSKDCLSSYDKKNVHFGENIHVMGLRSPHKDTDVYAYYKRLYSRVIEKACNEGKIDHLVLNGVGDGAFANNNEEKKLNAQARLDALIEHKELIKQNGMKIILTDYATNFNKMNIDKFNSAMDALEGMSLQILYGKDADLQGQVLAAVLKDSTYVGLVNASDQQQYGCHFLKMLGDNTVEERIWNQMFIGAHYDAVVASYPDDFEKYIHIQRV